MNSFFNKGLIAIIVSSFLYGLQGVFIRLIGVSFGIFYPFVIRGIIISSILFIFLYFSKTFKKIISRDYKWFILMSLSGIISFIAIFIAYNNLTIGTVLFVYYAGLALNGFLFGYFFFNEKINTVKAIALILSLTGIFLVFSSSILQKELLFLLLALVSGIASSFWFITSKKISTYPYSQILAVDSLVVFIVCLIISVVVGEHMSFPSLSIQWISVFGLTAVSLGAFLLSVYGFRLLQAQVASLLLLLEVVFGVFLGWIFFSEIPTSQALIGGGLILIGVSLPNLPFKKTT